MHTKINKNQLNWCSGYLEVVKYLVENGADIRAKNNGGQTALDVSVANGMIRNIKYIRKPKKIIWIGSQDTQKSSNIFLKKHQFVKLKMIRMLMNKTKRPVKMKTRKKIEG